MKAGIVSAMSAMLRSLRIRNLALVEELSWELPAGFITITGLAEDHWPAGTGKGRTNTFKIQMGTGGGTFGGVQPQ